VVSPETGFASKAKNRCESQGLSAPRLRASPPAIAYARLRPEVDLSCWQTMPRRAIWTIGHSNHSFETFASMLAGQRIEFVVDVRSYPYSRIAPQYNRESLQHALRERGIRYLFLGKELGGRPEKDEHYDGEGHALYGPMSEEPQFGQAIDRLLAGVEGNRIALVCSEADPGECHRRLLVGKVLADRGLQLHHIRGDGSVSVEDRVRLDRTDQGSLFEEGAEAAWRSTQSVSHRRRLNTSSAA
jgi:hypothetical protein